MAKDLIYYFDKKTYTKTELGEIQSQFNMSFVIDGTKDSCQVNVWSFSGNEVEPYTIIYHAKTDSWWITTHDKVERYQNDSGFIYMHSLELMGAIELLNARDLTDIGFYQNNYTIQTFINRLFNRSNYELSPVTTISNDVLALSENVDYIKTYENYTLLSALKDFLGGYNVTPKLSFNVDDSTNKITGTNLLLYAKTGKVNSTPIDISLFDNVRETKTIDKNSYGTTVVSNVDNATATKMQVFPVWGGVRLVSNSHNLDLTNAYVRLPSNLNNIEWVKIFYEETIKISNSGGTMLVAYNVYSFDSNSIDSIIEKITTYLTTNYADFVESWEEQKEELKKYMLEMGVSTLYKGIGINPVTNAYENPNNLLIPEIHNSTTQQNLILVEKEVKQTLVKPTDGIGYEKGSNKIEIDFLGRTNHGYFTEGMPSCDCGYFKEGVALTHDNNYLSISVSCGETDITAKNLLFAVKYEPMNDIKVKIDNDRETNDIQIYNQNGKLTDSRAFSKLLDSYSKEISSDTITRYMSYYKFSDVPTIGSLVKSGNDLYVINNISLDFYENESSIEDDFGYFITAEVTMSKFVSTKSLMTNPNSNIRDYGIPQKNTVKRKQLYRDYVEFNFLSSNRTIQYYRSLDKVLDFYTNMEELARSLIRVTFANNNNYYYQLDTTRYVMKKNYVTMVDFQDNNIIGYDFQNRFSGFQVSRVLSADGMNNNTNIPIQYTDDNGKVKGISLILLNEDNYNEIIDGYIELQSANANYKYVLTSRCFINNGIYSRNTGLGYGLTINENSYYKDPLEIPVFEYIAQINSTKEVLVCENVFITDLTDDIMICYSCELVDKNKANEYNCDLYYNNVFSATITNAFTISNAVKLEYSGYGTAIKLLVKLYLNYDYSTIDGEEWGEPLDYFQVNRDDIIIYRNYIKKTVSGDDTTFTLERHEPVMVLKLNSNATISSNTITLYPDTYKLK